MTSFPYSQSRVIWVGFISIALKEIRRFLRIYSQTLLTPMISVMLYFLIFGKVLGDRMGDLQGFSYIHYIAPGLLIMAVLNNSFGNVAHSFFMHKFQGIIYSMLASPTPIFAVFMGFIVGGIIRGLSVGLLIYITISLFVDITIYNIPLFISIILVSSLLLSLIGLFSGLFAKTFDQVAVIPTFVLVPLTYLGGVFFPVSILSETIQSIAKLNPIYYMIDGFRYSMLGVSETNAYLSVGILSFICIIGCGVLFYLSKNNVLKK